MTPGARKWIRALVIGFCLLVVANGFNSYKIYHLARGGSKAHAALCRADTQARLQNRQTLAILANPQEMKRLSSAGLTRALLLRGVKQRRMSLKANANLGCKGDPK